MELVNCIKKYSLEKKVDKNVTIPTKSFFQRKSMIFQFSFIREAKPQNYKIFPIAYDVNNF